VSFRVEVRHSAEKELGRLSTQAQQRIAVALLGLAEQPLPPNVKQLKGSDGYRIRIGDYQRPLHDQYGKQGDFGFRHRPWKRGLSLKVSNRKQ